MFDTLRSRLVPLVAGTSLFVGTILSTMGYLALKSELQENALNNLEHAASYFAAEVASELDMMRRESKLLAHTPEVRNAIYAIKGLDAGPEGLATEVQWAASQLDELLATFLQEHAFVSRVRLIGPGENAPEIIRVDREGTEAIVVPASELIEAGGEKYMRSAQSLRARESYLSDVMPEQKGEETLSTIRFIYAAPDDTGDVGAYLVINADFSALIDNALQKQLDEYAVTIWTMSGDALDLSELNPPVMRFGAVRPGKVPLAGTQLDELQALHVNWIETVGGKSFAVSSAIPRSVFEDGSKEGLKAFLLIATVLCAVSTMAATWMARHLAEPLEALAAAVTARRSRFSEPVLPMAGYREVRVLAKSFRGVTNALASEARQVAWQANHDKLSELLNRRGFEDALAERSQRPGTVTLIQFDLDRFKLVNDTHGHEAGDAVIAAIGQRLTGLHAEGDFAGRMGGDEFILLREGGTPADIEEFAAKAIPILSVPVLHNGRTCRFGVSMGAAIGPAEGLRDDSLIKRADLALYRAKGDGRGRCQIFDSSMEQRMTDRAEALLGLENAIERQAIRVVYQPKVSVEGRSLVGFEAQPRWLRDDGTIMSPNTFMPLAEEAGLLERIEQHVLQQVGNDINQWRQNGLTPPTISVNASARYLRNSGVVDLIKDLRLPMRSLAVELQESALLDAEGSDVLKTLERLKDLHVGVSIDNFGAGHASILSLARIEPDWVNIDQALVTDIATDLSMKLLVKAVVDMAIPMGAGVHAVGVETDAQAEALGAVGCGTMQGGRIGPAVSAAAVVRSLESGVPSSFAS